tara:strand:- start:600 stop:1172 length:573 start_codon:yes stop_codon:yes gene_type:complete
MKNINKNNINFIFLTIMLLLLIYSIYLDSYIRFLPTIPIYPNNIQEAQLVYKHTLNRSKYDVMFFHKTNESVSHAFKPYVNESIEELNQISTRYNNLIYFFKYTINRARPAQVYDNIKPIDTSTAQTPAYPAGHAFQAQVLANNLSKKYPSKKKLFNKLSLQCDTTRVKAGLHYFSDGEFSRKLVKLLNI